jgi:catechol 2,3-dioxygenase-like lactoylglutathione lyase family enzyme
MSETLATTLQTGHVGLNVSDLQRSKAFYQEVFGLELHGESLEPGRRYAFLRDSERLVLTLWEQAEGRFPADRPGLHHLSFQVPDLDSVKAMEARAHSIGARMIYDGPVPHSEGSASGGVFFEDPDGIRLEVYAPGGLKGRGAPTCGTPSCGFF